VPHWAGLVVCGAGLVLLAATVAERFVRRRAGRPRVRQAPLPAGRPTQEPQTSADRNLSHQAAPSGSVPSPRRADSPRPGVRATAVTGPR